MAVFQDGLEGFEKVEDPRSSDYLGNNDEEMSADMPELGSQASHQAIKKAKKLAASPKTPTNQPGTIAMLSLMLQKLPKTKPQQKIIKIYLTK
eukprot:13237093-Ditylum_brightwellii.AAC.1